MPSCTNAKVENKPSSEVTVSPIRQVLVIIEHKVRNLEKRKSKLDTYKELQNSGKEMTADQKIATSKYDEVTKLLEFARELYKQIQGIVTVTEKEQRKAHRRDVILRTQQEAAKIREVLIIQDTISNLKNERVREDFINGTNGACKLEPTDLEILDKLYFDVTPQRELENEGDTFSVLAQKSADHILNIIDSRTKPYGDTNYAKLNAIFQNICSSDYFEKKTIELVETVDENNEISTETTITEELAIECNQNNVQPIIENNVQENDVQLQIIAEAPAPKAVPIPTFPPQMPLSQPQNIPQTQQVLIQPIVPAQGVAVVTPTVAAVTPQNQIHPAHLGPTTVRAVEQAYFKQHQYIQQMRPISEVLETSSFFFLQDSELDSPDPFPVAFQAVPAPIVGAVNSPSPVQPQTVVSQQQQQPPPPQQQPPIIQSNQQQQNSSGISTQTFTNQNFKTIVPQTAVYNGPEITSPHIPGFATTNSPIPVTIQTLTPLQQQPQQQQQPPVHIIAPVVPTVVPIPGFVSPQQFPLPPGTNVVPTIMPIQQQQIIQQQPPSLPIKETILMSETTNVIIKQQAPHSQIDVVKTIINNSNLQNTKEQQQQMPPIENWNVNDGKDDSMEWQDTSSSGNRNNDSKEWNSNNHNDNKQHNNESNTWSDSQNQMSSDGYGSSRGGYSRGGRGGRGGSRGGPPNGYRGRSNNSYQSNNGGGGGRSSGSGGGGGSSGNTFYRNNDNNYYQNGSYNNSNRQDNNSGGNGGGSSGYSNGSYKPRGSGTGGGNTGGGMRGGSMRGSGNNGNNTDRSRTNDSNNMNNRNTSGNMRSSTRGGGGGSGGSGGGGGGYGGHRTGGSSTRPQQSVNINA